MKSYITDCLQTPVSAFLLSQMICLYTSTWFACFLHVSFPSLSTFPSFFLCFIYLLGANHCLILCNIFSLFVLFDLCPSYKTGNLARAKDFCEYHIYGYRSVSQFAYYVLVPLWLRSGVLIEAHHLRSPFSERTVTTGQGSHPCEACAATLIPHLPISMPHLKSLSSSLGGLSELCTWTWADHCRCVSMNHLKIVN